MFIPFDFVDVILMAKNCIEQVDNIFSGKDFLKKTQIEK